MRKLWTEYKNTNWDQVKLGLSKIIDLGAKIGDYREDGKNVWYLASVFKDLAETQENDAFWYTEKNCLSLFDAGLGFELEAAINGLPAVASAPAAKIESDLFRRLASAGVKADIIKNWQNIYSSAVDKKIIEEKFGLIVDLLEVLSGELVLLGVVITPTISPFAYDAEEAVAFLKGKKRKEPYDMLKVARALHESVLGEKEARAVATAAVEFLYRGGGVEFKEVEWLDAVIYFLIVDCAYRFFGKLLDEERQWLLSTNFYRAVALGVPVRAILQENLRSALNVVEYVSVSKSWVEILEKSAELVIVYAGGNSVEKKLSEILKDFTASAGKDLSDKAKIEKFVGDFYSASPVGANDAGWLAETLDIYANLKRGTLVDWIKESAVSLADQYEIDVLQLILSFGMAMDYLFIDEYYKKTDPLVSFAAFIGRLKNAVDLADESNLQNCLRFSEWLHGRKLLAPDKELIYYNESDGKFYWSENL